MKTSWEKIKGPRTEYVDVTRNQVIVGHHYGTGMSDTAGSCSHQEFLEGRFQDLILERFGEIVLQEVIKTVRKASIYPPFLEQKKEIKQLRQYLDAIPIDLNLKKLNQNPNIINGFSFYGNNGGYKTIIESDTATLFFDSERGYIEKGSERIRLELPGHGSAVVELHDLFYIIIDQNLVVINIKGRIAYNSTNEHVKGNIKEQIFGSYLRMNSVFRHEETIFVSYWWFNHEFNDGLLKFELGKGFTGRWEISDE